jgi:hypothetical protein
MTCTTFRTIGTEKGFSCRVLACDVSLSGLDDGSASLLEGGGQSIAANGSAPSPKPIITDEASSVSTVSVLYTGSQLIIS